VSLGRQAEDGIAPRYDNDFQGVKSLLLERTKPERTLNEDRVEPRSTVNRKREVEDATFGRQWAYLPLSQPLSHSFQCDEETARSAAEASPKSAIHFRRQFIKMRSFRALTAPYPSEPRELLRDVDHITRLEGEGLHRFAA